MHAGIKLVLGVALLGGVCFAAPERVQGPDGCPLMDHVPLSVVPRGVPASVSADVSCPSGQVASVTLYVRVTDAGKPTSHAMNGEGDGTYQALVPLSLIQGVERFWYYLDARGAPAEQGGQEEAVAQTRWHAVTIVEAVDPSSSSKGLSWKKAGLWGGGAGLLALLLLNRDDDDSEPEPLPSEPEPDGGRDDEEDEEDEDDEAPAPAATGGDTPVTTTPEEVDEPEVVVDSPCTLTGSEAATLSSTSPCDASDMEIRICNTCTNVTIEATATLGESSSATGYSGESCAPTAPAALLLPKPEVFPQTAESYTIEVRVNGTVISSTPWPSTQELSDCL